MIPATPAQQLAWMTQWRSAAVELARARQAERDTQLSGLVEQQRWLHRRELERIATRTESVIGAFTRGR